MSEKFSDLLFYESGMTHRMTIGEKNPLEIGWNQQWLQLRSKQYVVQLTFSHFSSWEVTQPMLGRATGQVLLPQGHLTRIKCSQSSFLVGREQESTTSQTAGLFSKGPYFHGRKPLSDFHRKCQDTFQNVWTTSTWAVVIPQVNSGFQPASQTIVPSLVNEDIQKLSRPSNCTYHLSTPMIAIPAWA